MRVPLAVCVLTLGLLIFVQPPARAAEPSCPPGATAVLSQLGGWICTAVTDPGTPGGGDADGGGDSGVGGTCYDGKQEVACVTDAGIWFASRQCYAHVARPQPPASDPAWGGHDPSEGQLWACTVGSNTIAAFFFVANGVTALVDPAVLAQQAVGRMRLQRAHARIAPGPEFHTYVHIDNWMWVPPGQWRDLRLTVSAGATSVTVTAGPTRVEWDMGSDTKRCYAAGRAWRMGMTDAAKTTCSFAYETLENPKGDTHNVSAQIVYSVTWTCSGACLSPSGDLGEIAAPSGETTTIEVRQRQTVVTQ